MRNDGTVLKYDATHVEDEYGCLSEASVDPVQYQAFAIDAAVFEAMWPSALEDLKAAAEHEHATRRGDVQRN